jgi:hypothetical protein
MARASGFEFTRHGDAVVITHRGRKAATLRGVAATRFLEDVERDDPRSSWPAPPGTSNEGTNGWRGGTRKIAGEGLLAVAQVGLLARDRLLLAQASRAGGCGLLRYLTRTEVRTREVTPDGRRLASARWREHHWTRVRHASGSGCLPSVYARIGLARVKKTSEGEEAGWI